MHYNFNCASRPPPWYAHNGYDNYSSPMPMPPVPPRSPHWQWQHGLYNSAYWGTQWGWPGGWQPNGNVVQYPEQYSQYCSPYMMKRRTESRINEEPPKKSFWAAGLLAAMEDPKCVVKQDDKIVIIKDKYPKAEFHFLVLPKEDISNLNKLNREHISLLEHMEEAGQQIAKEHPDHKFLFGYHALASMIRLHLHVISDDFNSLSLKTKKHWNSFTTPFFIPSRDVIETIRRDGKAKEISRSRAKELMDTPLKCHKCRIMLPNMPKLKQHLLVHQLKEKHASEK